MNTVWKFQIPALTQFNVTMPKNAQIIHVDSQLEQACLWAVVDPGALTETRSFILVETGHDIPAFDYPLERLKHCGTFMLSGGSLVFHLFEKVKN